MVYIGTIAVTEKDHLILAYGSKRASEIKQMEFQLNKVVEEGIRPQPGIIIVSRADDDPTKCHYKHIDDEIDWEDWT